MRFVVLMAAMAATLVALPAAAQKKPQTAEPFKADAVKAGPDTVVALPTAPDPENTWVLDLSDGGRVMIRMRPDVAPKMVERVKMLTRQHFYDNTPFHRVNDAPEGMAQGGDPTGTGAGGSPLPDLPAEFNTLPHLRGTVSAARKQEPNTANSQFFIMFSPKLAFDQNYTVFGRVISGMQWVDAIERGDPPPNPTRVVHAYIQADNPPPYQNAVVDKPALPAGETEVTLPGTTPPKP